MTLMARRVAFMLIFLLFLPWASGIEAHNFSLPEDDSSLLGETGYIHTAHGDTPASIAQRYNLGVNAIIAANPGTTETTVFSSGSTIQVPTAFLLPPLPHKGIVVNLPEMRLYYFLPNGEELMTFPIGIGRIGNTIPIIRTAIARKVEHPIWIPPADIRKYNEEQGIDLPRIMQAGPDNPLGPYAIYLRLPTYLIHSTIFPDSIGRRASFGCIRMNESDINQFFPIVTAGTPVEIVDMPNKVGWDGDSLYLEAHPPLEERRGEAYATLDGIVNLIQKQLPKGQMVLVNWQLVASIASQPDGIPHAVAVKVN